MEYKERNEECAKVVHRKPLHPKVVDFDCYVGDELNDGDSEIKTDKKCNIEEYEDNSELDAKNASPSNSLGIHVEESEDLDFGKNVLLIIC